MTQRGSFDRKTKKMGWVAYYLLKSLSLIFVNDIVVDH